jgi:hypothetical protein
MLGLSAQQKDRLRIAIVGYAFPADHFDFSRNAPERLADTRAVEIAIGRDLRSGEPELVKNGLSNVLYWGYGQMGIRDTRVSRFRTKVTSSQLTQAGALFRRSPVPSVAEIKRLDLPEFSGLSFVSKIRMFLDPDHSATLDRQIMKIHRRCTTTVLALFCIGTSTQIRITANNSDAYETWCIRMSEISRRHFEGRFRAVDIERGLFQLIQRDDVEIAAQILNDA